MTHSAAIGEPLDRVDGPLKVTGRAPYAAEHKLRQAPLIGWIVEATIPAGRITQLDTSAAEKSPGVVAVLTHRNVPQQRPPGEPEDEGDLPNPGRCCSMTTSGTTAFRWRW